MIRRNGAVVGFEPAKITIAMTKAFLAVNGGQGASSARVRDEVARLTDAVVAALMKRKPDGGAIHIEEIQDQVELALMRGGEHEVARAYVLYREKRAQERALHGEPDQRDGERGERQRGEPRPGAPDDRQRHVAAEQEVRAVRQVDDAHHAEDQRQAARQQEQQRAVRHAVEDLDQPELGVHAPAASRARAA